MSGKWSLQRTRQCDKCPWRTSTDPHDIPNGYCETKHRALESTVAKPGTRPTPYDTLRVMACHDSPVDAPAHCVGWLANQLGLGNNIGLRLRMLSCTNGDRLQLRGPQHDRFEDTLP